MTRPCLSIAFFEKLGCGNVSELFCAGLIAAAQNDNSHTTVLTRPSASRAFDFYRFQ